MTLYGSSDLKLIDSKLVGTGNPIYAQARIEMTGCEVEMYGNNAILSLSYCSSSPAVIFKNNTVVNKSTNSSVMYGMQCLSTNGKVWSNMYFDVQNNDGVDVTYAIGSTYTFPGVTYAPGSEEI